MTALGKTMAIFVLIFSIVQGFLTVMLFATRAHWGSQYQVLQKQVQIAEASVKQFQADVEQARADAKNEKAAQDARITKAETDLKVEIARNTGLERQLADQRNKTDEQTAIATAAQKDVQTRQADNERMLTAIKERDAANAQLVADNKKEREDRVNAEIQMRTALLQMQKMEEKLRDSMKELAKRSQAGTTVTAGKSNAPNPPTESVEGLVSETDNSGLMKITIGSDAGLREGHTLDLYRIAAIPAQSQYLGMIRIRKVTPNEAVAEPVGRLAAPAQRGDQVSSRILGGS
jgi:hypothetical protein